LKRKLIEVVFSPLVTSTPAFNKLNMIISIHLLKKTAQTSSGAEEQKSILAT
jgi:hypothetical protein